MLSACTILHKRSSVSNRVPDLTALQLGELAVNTADGKIFTKTSGSEIISFIDSSATPYVLDQSLSAINTQYGANTVTGLFAGVLNGFNNDVSGSGSTVANGEDNDIDSDFSFIGSGWNNKIALTADYGAILGGSNNNLNHTNSFIVGTDITSHAENFTYVNNLSVLGKIYGDGSSLLGVTGGGGGGGSDVSGLSAKWEDSSTFVQTYSAEWGYQGTDIKSLSSDWQSVYTTFKNTSSTFLTSETDSQTLSFDETSKNLSISNGNAVSLSALVDSAGMDTGVRALSSTWQNTSTVVQSNSATWATPVRKFDMVYSPAVVSYSGIAVNGSLTSQSVWTVTKITYSAAGTISAQVTATNAIWDDRLSLTYS